MSDEQPKKKKLDPKRRSMPKQDHHERIKNFEEVAYGYPVETAVEEASRCLSCKTAPCNKGCPVGIDIPGFIKCIVARDFAAGIRKIKETNALPAICGRVCPQEEQCEKQCVVGRRARAIGRLERFLADGKPRGKTESPRWPPRPERGSPLSAPAPPGSPWPTISSPRP